MTNKEYSKALPDDLDANISDTFSDSKKDANGYANLFNLIKL
jgi:hypothetical protein